SMVALSWIRGDHSSWKQFVANRVAEIQALTSDCKWHFCPGSLNPADIPTRGTSITQLASSTLWWQGPQFLNWDEGQWPREPTPSVPDDQPEVNVERSKLASVRLAAVTTQPVLDLERYGSFVK